MAVNWKQDAAEVKDWNTHAFYFLHFLSFLFFIFNMFAITSNSLFFKKTLNGNRVEILWNFFVENQSISNQGS